MNKYKELSIHARSPQPSSNNDDVLSTASAPASASAQPPRSRTLKERIKWNMTGQASSHPFDLGSTGDAASYPGMEASQSSAPTSVSTAFVSKRSRNAQPTPMQHSTQPREESVLAAASALTSLRVTPPAATTGRATAPSFCERASSQAFGADAFGAAAASCAAMRALDYEILSEARELAGLPSSSSMIEPPSVTTSHPMPPQPRTRPLPPQSMLQLQPSSSAVPMDMENDQPQLSNKSDEEAHNSLLQTLQSLQPLQSGSCKAWLNDEVAELKRNALDQLSSENPLSMAMDDAKGSLGGVDRPFSSLVGSDVPLTFPQKLMEILSNPEISDIVAWLPHGRGFAILQKQRFAAEVMPLYFKHSKFTSFTRKLNRWGFVRVARGPETGSYYHRFFQRGNYLLCMKMQCQSNNKARNAKAKDAGPGSKPKGEEASSTPPPEIETPPERTEAMSPLEGVESPSPASANANGKDNARIPPLIFGGRSELVGPLSPISEGCETVFSSVGQPSPSRAGGALARFSHLQKMQQQQQRMGSFDRAFARQQEILRKANPASMPYRMALDSNRGRAGSSSNLTPSSSSSSLPKLQSRLPWLSLPEARSMQQLQHPHPSWNRQASPPHAPSNADLAITVQNLMGVNAVSSPSHHLTVTEAQEAPHSLEVEASRHSILSSSTSGVQGAVPASSGGVDLHSAMLEKMRQLDRELKAQQAIIAQGGGKAAGGLKVRGGDLMSQRNVAQLYHRINAGQLERQAPGDVPGVSGEQKSKQKYRAVRRASAA